MCLIQLQMLPKKSEDITHLSLTQLKRVTLSMGIILKEYEKV